MDYNKHQLISNMKGISMKWRMDRLCLNGIQDTKCCCNPITKKRYHHQITAPIMNLRKMCNLMELFLVRKKDISNKTTDQRTSQSGNAMKKNMNTRHQISEIFIRVALRS